MHSLPDWCSALFANWQTWASGGFGGAVLLLAQIAEWLNVFSLKPRTKVFLVVWCFIVGASFMAWKDEHMQKEQALQKVAAFDRPEFHAEAEEIAVGDGHFGAKRSVTSVLYVLTVKNFGAPSVIDRFELRFTLPPYKDCRFVNRGNPSWGDKL